MLAVEIWVKRKVQREAWVEVGKDQGAQEFSVPEKKTISAIRSPNSDALLFFEPGIRIHRHAALTRIARIAY